MYLFAQITVRSKYLKRMNDKDEILEYKNYNIINDGTLKSNQHFAFVEKNILSYFY